MRTLTDTGRPLASISMLRSPVLMIAPASRSFSSVASSVSGALLPTSQPFLYTISLTAMQGVELSRLEAAANDAIAHLHQHGVTEEEAARARRQLRARFVFENDSVTNIAHQLGYFATIGQSSLFSDLAARIKSVTAEAVFEAARRRLSPAKRTVGWFRPIGGRA